MKKLTDEEKVARSKAKREAKEKAELEAKKNQSPVKSITITIEWKRSSTWGYNPHCEAAVEFKDGHFERSANYTCSGCGYDKESTVIAMVFRDYLSYKLFRKRKGEAPYGMSVKCKSYSGGVGTSCYYSIANYIGGQFHCLASGKTFDVFKYTDKRERKS
jgi:hypothetical protein